MFSNYLLMVMSGHQATRHLDDHAIGDYIPHLNKYLLRIFPVLKGIIPVSTKQLKQPIKSFHYI